MSDKYSAVPILVCEDTPDDCEIFSDAIKRGRIANPVFFVEDGEEGLAYLNGTGEFADRNKYPLPGLIFMDINMPKLNGLQVLEGIRANASLETIPVVMLTVSDSDEDILRSYELDTVVYIQKPVTAENLTAVMHSLEQFEIQLVEDSNA
ncbi:MAG TPA: response regulator [Myxococcales bacterium]|nr:response regulator [Myxococcales bacterium]